MRNSFPPPLRASQAALKTHHTEKLEALRNAVLNAAAGSGPSEDLQTAFLSFVDSFTPAHIHVLCFFERRESAALEQLSRRRAVTDQVVRDLESRGLIADTRAYAARGEKPRRRSLPMGGT